MYRRVPVALIASAIFLLIGCEDSPFDPSTSGSSEGDSCNLEKPGQCGSGLECYVPPNCSAAVCCPPQDPSNPVCYCAAAASDASQDAVDKRAATGRR